MPNLYTQTPTQRYLQHRHERVHYWYVFKGKVDLSEGEMATMGDTGCNEGNPYGYSMLLCCDTGVVL